jgi:predicted dehydrogenase
MLVTGRSNRDARRLALVGGGRWARVLCGVLLDITPSDVCVDVYTRGNALGMREWAVGRNAERIEVLQVSPDFRERSRPDAVIVANASHDHARVAGAAVRAGIPTLVEKPLAVTEANARELIALAEKEKVVLAASRVLLFARYIESFAREVAARPVVKEAQFTWADPSSETRYGETKRYDPGVAIASDVLPHVLPVLRMLFGAATEFVDLGIARGGTQTDLHIKVANIPCRLSLARNSDARRRFIDVETSTGSLQLDFSQEPGRIVAGGRKSDGDPQWNSQPRPLARMLRTFLMCAAEGVTDDRLSPASAIEECRVADLVSRAYCAKQTEWLVAQIGRSLNDDIRYVLAELSLAQGQSGDERIEQTWAEMTRLGADAVADMLSDPAMRARAIDQLGARRV